MKSIALFGIGAYQRYVSPRKGFCCAYRAWTGRRSCSVFGYRAIRRYGVWAGIAILRRRFARCADALQALRTLPSGIDRQRGFCDVSCDLPCDVPWDCLGNGLDALDCCDVFDAWRERKKSDEPVMVELPSRRWGDDA